jgi:hypothetical protein
LLRRLRSQIRKGARQVFGEVKEVGQSKQGRVKFLSPGRDAKQASQRNARHLQQSVLMLRSMNSNLRSKFAVLGGITISRGSRFASATRAKVSCAWLKKQWRRKCPSVREVKPINFVSQMKSPRPTIRVTSSTKKNRGSLMKTESPSVYADRIIGKLYLEIISDRDAASRYGHNLAHLFKVGPVLTSTGRGSDLIIPMAIPIFCGMFIGLLTMFVVPVLFCLVREVRSPGTPKKKSKPPPISMKHTDISCHSAYLPDASRGGRR